MPSFRLLLPVVFGLGVIAGCAEDAGPPPLLRQNDNVTSRPKAPKKSESPSETQVPTPTSQSEAPPEGGAPTLSAIAPDAVTLGTTPQGIELTLTGTNFVSGAQVDLAGNTLPATFVSSTQLTVRVPADKTLASGVFRVLVLADPTVRSNPLTFTVANPSSVSIAKLVPNVATVGATAPVKLAITGSGFVPTSLVSFNGTALTTTFTSATELEATIPAGAFVDAGRVGVTVSSGGNIVSLPVGFEVRNPAPQATAMTPRSATAGAAALSVTIDGNGFTKSSSVLASGSPLATTFVSAQRLRATIPAALLASARTLSLSVRSPAPGGGTGAAQSFTVQAAATTSGSTGTPNPASCLYLCTDYGYAPGQCFEDWYCLPSGEYAGCLGQTQCN